MTRYLLPLLLSLTACEPDAGLVVGKVGDSIMALMGEELDVQAQRRDNGPSMVTLAAFPGLALGRDLPYFTQRITSLRERVQPDAVVISLGTNDTAELGGFFITWPLVDTEEKLAHAIDGLMASLPTVPVLWLVPSSPRIDPDRRSHIFAGLLLATTRWPNLRLLEQPEIWFEGGDGIHHSPAGEAMAAEAIIETLSEVDSQP